MLTKGVCQGQEVKRLAGLSTQIKSEILGLQDQLTSFAGETMTLEEGMHNWTWKTVLKCSDVMICQSNLILINVTEYRFLPPAMGTCQVSSAHLSSAQYPESFSYINWFQRVGVTRDSRPCSIFLQCSTIEARGVTWVIEVFQHILSCTILEWNTTLQVTRNVRSSLWIPSGLAKCSYLPSPATLHLVCPVPS